MKAFELRKQTKAELTKNLADLKQELASLRVQQISNGAASKIAQISSVRKSIARVMTVMTQMQRESVKALFAKKKYAPLDMRSKKTRAIRRRLTKSESHAKSLRQVKKELNFPAKTFILKA